MRVLQVISDMRRLLRTVVEVKRALVIDLEHSGIHRDVSTDRFGERSKSSLGGKNGFEDVVSSSGSSSEGLIREWKRRFESRLHGGLGGVSRPGQLQIRPQRKNKKKKVRRKSVHENPIQLTPLSFRRKNVGDGEITEQLATLLKSLWSLEYTPEISVKFKALIEKYGGAQYKGNAQQDAQEFLLWLLDRVHEDLNCSPGSNKQPGKRRPFFSEEEVLAQEALSNYARCNSSFVMDVFQAQFRSSLTCRTCDRVSNTFDPSSAFPSPFPPGRNSCPWWPTHVKIGLSVEEGESIRGLRDILSRDTGIQGDCLFLTELDETRFTPNLSEEASLGEVLHPDATDLYCIELPQAPRLAKEEEDAFLLLSWVNVLKIDGKVEKRFGTPYAIQVSRETLYCDLQKLLLKEMSPILHSDVLEDKNNSSTYLSPGDELPLYTELIEKALKQGSVVKLVCEWDALAKSQIINDDSSPVEIHSSVASTLESGPKEASSVSLQECFSLYTSEERLGQGDAWFCPECNRKREVVKKMGLWSLPDVSLSTDKLLTHIDFPLDGFDMSPNVSRSSSPPHQQQQHSGVESSLNKVLSFNPWRNPKRYILQRPPQEENHIYDLYAVCNHHGSDLQGGHYTATCRNPTDGVWYNFDDVRTKSLPESEVVTKDAYILFYQRRNCSGGSTTTTSTPPNNNHNNHTELHWVYRMPDFNFCKNKSSTLRPTPSNNNFLRNSEKYATLPAKKMSPSMEMPSLEIGPKLAIPEEEDEEDVSRPLDKNDVD
ncbi:Ubiquitin carboxylterminal hydrolase 31like [Caligus rogercresseyi]|uniref:ubiquitinyl hydrolase 1 n=1 Tax=Caligus rogercresseyi TaxID=217165 RepID=A0A7T8H2R9_CALRO|nr:Ubiquitin carboxylterminal hydrolase 31like [Caligus rogercresseyi]